MNNVSIIRSQYSPVFKKAHKFLRTLLKSQVYAECVWYRIKDNLLMKF